MGKLGEELACKYLENNGYRILRKNYRIKFTEIDIIAISNRTLIIVEVKTRKNSNFSHAREAVNWKKRLNIIALTKHFIDEFSLYNYNVRFDIIECYWDTKRIVHLVNAFEV